MWKAGIFVCATFLLVGCTSADDGVTDDANEINEGRGSLERELTPQLAAPASDFIGAKMADVLVKAKGTATALSPKKISDDCKRIDYKDAGSKKIIAQDEQCSDSETVRTLTDDGTVSEEHMDLNKDGKVDRYASTDGAVVTLGDSDYDGTVDLVIERVDRVKDFSTKGYEDQYPKSAFLHRVREDRDHDGKLDHERLTAKGALAAAPPKDDAE